MPGPSYDSISRYSNHKERYYVHNVVKKAEPKALLIRAENRFEPIEKSWLAGIARGGKWVLFALLYLPFFFFVGVPRWLRHKVWSKGANLLKRGCAWSERFMARLIRPFILLKQWILKKLYQIFIYPFIRLGRAVNRGCEKVDRMIAALIGFPSRFMRKAADWFARQIERLKMIPAIIEARVARLKLRLRELAFAPFRLVHRGMVRFLESGKRGIWVVGAKVDLVFFWVLAVWNRGWLRFTAPFIKLKKKALLIFHSFRGFKLPKFSFKVTWSNPFRKLLERVKPLRFKINLPRFKITLPAFPVKFKLRFPEIPFPNLKIDLGPVKAWAKKRVQRLKLPRINWGGFFFKKCAVANQRFRRKLRFIPLSLNMMLLLVDYWYEQVKNLLAASFKFD
jgi:hypothetical protein